MKHIPLLAKEDADPEIRKAWEAMGFDLALFHVAAHASNTFLKWAAFNGTIWQDEEDGFPLRLKEMAVVQASVLSNSSYEWGNHGVQMINRGASQAQLDALVEGDSTSGLFDDTEKLVLQFTTEVVMNGRASEATLSAMSEKYTSKQLTQLVYGICTYMMNSRLANLGGCEIGDDEDFGMFSLGRKT
jgi:alkylhydroperoxidase family enzyme